MSYSQRAADGVREAQSASGCAYPGRSRSTVELPSASSRGREAPRLAAPESTLSLLREGYEFGARRFRRVGGEIFQARVLLEPTIFLRGPEAAALFYDGELFQRAGAAPGRMQKTLTGEGAVQSLDDDRHHDRKAMFMAALPPEEVRALVEAAEEEWSRASTTWATRDSVCLLQEAEQLLTRAVCRWADVPLSEERVESTSRRLVALIEGPAALFLRYYRARWARWSLEKWCRGLISEVREGNRQPRDGCALHMVSSYRGREGRPLELQTAAVELLNILRPTVAVSRYIVFAALALENHPTYREWLRAGGEKEYLHFVQEVRRTTPFFPLAAARVRRDFLWKGYRFPAGRRVLLDLHGTNRHPEVWAHPHAFWPERFAHRTPGPFELIPQGGSEHGIDHRCAGEAVTVSLIVSAIRFLLNRISYRVPDQDLTVRLNRIPSRPESGFVIAGVRERG